MTETQTHPGTHTALPTAEEIALDVGDDRRAGTA